MPYAWEAWPTRYRAFVSILAYGALNPDLVHRVHRLPQAGDDVRSSSWHLTWGGKVCNAGMALVTWGESVRLSGLVLGDDALGAALLASLDRPGIDSTHVEMDVSERTRHCVVLVTPDGDRTIVCTGYESARWTTLDLSAWAGVEAVIVDAFSADAGRSVAADARSRELPVVWIDPEPHDSHLATVAVWSSAERTPEEAEASRAGTTLLTAGSGPIEVWTGGRRLSVQPPGVTTIDATGAGDVLAAGCAYGILRGWSTERIVTWAAAAGAAMAASGRDTHLPTVADVEALLA